MKAITAKKIPDYEMPRVRGSGSLTQQQRNTLRALGAWRELKARSRNLPRGFILSDDALVSLIKRPPEKLEDIRQMKGLSERSADRNRKYIWEALERGRSGDLPDLPNNKHNGPRPTTATRHGLIFHWHRLKASASRI
jgi:ribonuclease D